jgi:signal transduction histidine kinase
MDSWDTFMKLDLLIVSLQLSGLILTFLLDDRNRVELALRESELQLKEINKSKDKLFSIIAHDLKSPFTSIVGYSEILKDYTTNCNQQEIVNYASIINTSSKQTLQLLENLLDWARLQQGRIAFHPQNLNLQELTHEVIGLIKDIAEQKGISVQNTIPDSLNLHADKEMLKTVLRNLASNAVKFTPKGGFMEVSSKSSDKEVFISVTDNGVGISADDIGKLFDISSNFSTKGTNEEQGTGLGLSLCKEFVEKHNGKVWVKSEPAKGSVFTISLPLIQP